MLWRSSGNWSARCSGQADLRQRLRARQRRRRSAVRGPVYMVGRKSVKVLPMPGVLRKRQLAAQQRRELAADGEAQAGAAVLAAGAGVGLLEGLEHDLLLLDRRCRRRCR